MSVRLEVLGSLKVASGGWEQNWSQGVAAKELLVAGVLMAVYAA